MANEEHVKRLKQGVAEWNAKGPRGEASAVFRGNDPASPWWIAVEGPNRVVVMAGWAMPTRLTQALRMGRPAAPVTLSSVNAHSARPVSGRERARLGEPQNTPPPLASAVTVHVEKVST